TTGHFAQDDQAGAILFRVEGGVDLLVGDDDVGQDVGGDGVGRGADLQVAALQHQEVADDHLGVDVGAELEAGGGLDLEGLEVGGGDDVVGDGVAGVDIDDVPGARQPAQRPHGGVGPVAALDADDGGQPAEVGDLVEGGDDVRIGHRGNDLGVG